MRKVHTVFMLTRDSRRIGLQVERRSLGRYTLVDASCLDSIDTLAGNNLCFDLTKLDPFVENKDFSSDSYSCFSMSEQLAGPEMSYADGVFVAKNLSQLQKSLDRIRGEFFRSDEY